jgi:hypothetical protein
VTKPLKAGLWRTERHLSQVLGLLFEMIFVLLFFRNTPPSSGLLWRPQVRDAGVPTPVGLSAPMRLANRPLACPRYSKCSFWKQKKMWAIFFSKDKMWVKWASMLEPSHSETSSILDCQISFFFFYLGLLKFILVSW